jgi:hypothetical protein
MKENVHIPSLFFLFVLHVHTRREGKFELVTSILLGVAHIPFSNYHPIDNISKTFNCIMSSELPKIVNVSPIMKLLLVKY